MQTGLRSIMHKAKYETTPVTTVAASRRNSPFAMLMTIHVSAPIKATAITVFAKYPLLNLT